MFNEQQQETFIKDHRETFPGLSKCYNQMAVESLANQDRAFFEQWLVGFTDGDGYFNITKYKNNKYNLTFVLSQSLKNAKLIYFIKKKLGVGSVFLDRSSAKKFNQLSYRIQDLINLEKYIFPIFDKYTLLSTKYFSYIKFKAVHQILVNNHTSKERTRLIDELRLKDFSKDRDTLKLSCKFTEVNQRLSELETSLPYLINDKNILSPIWITKYFDLVIKKKQSLLSTMVLSATSKLSNQELDFTYWSSIITKPWLIGFIEAEGSFCSFDLINKKDHNFETRIVHRFVITQKKDKLILEGIRKLLHIPSKVNLNNKNFYSLENTNKKTTGSLCIYFNNVFKGRKSLEFRIWSRSYVKAETRFIKSPDSKTRNLKKENYLLKIKALLTKLNRNNKLNLAEPGL
jgi:hypothetical protein